MHIKELCASKFSKMGTDINRFFSLQIQGTTSYEGILFMLQIVAEFDKLHLCVSYPNDFF